MKTVVSIPHHEYPARVREHVEGELQDLLRFYDRIVSIRALLERDSDLHRVELVANVGHGVTLVVDSRAELLDGALEGAVERMKRVLKSHKGRLVDRRRRAARERR
jgi:ribosome-associated translation inhibitor RaiA